MKIKSLLSYMFCFPEAVKSTASNHFKDALPLRMRALVCVHTSMTSFSSRHLRRTMERGRREGGEEEERREGGGGGGRFVFTEKVRGQIIKSVRLLATSSNLKELINVASQACGSANQLSNRCLAMPMPSSERQERDRTSQRKTQRRGGQRGIRGAG